MAGQPKDPLRALTPPEHTSREHLSRSRTDPAAQVARAKALLAVADQPKRYTATEQERILQEVRGEPDREGDGTATWSLTTLQRASGRRRMACRR